MPKVVIADSTPLIVLANVSQLDILRRLYGGVIIPRAVYLEVTSKSDAASRAVRSCDWIQIRDVGDPGRKSEFRSRLHDGEVEAMLLAQDLSADLILIDDATARTAAESMGLTVTGTMGVLIRAKRDGVVEDVRPILEGMLANGFYVSGRLVDMVMRVAGEQKNA